MADNRKDPSHLANLDYYRFPGGIFDAQPIGGPTPRCYTIAQIKSMFRQMEHRQKQAIDKYNQAVRRHQASVRRVVDDYNREDRAHSARVLRNHLQIQSALGRLEGGRSGLTRHVAFRQSVELDYNRYALLESTVASRELDPHTEFLTDLSEREAVNTIGVAESLVGEGSSSASADVLGLDDITEESIQISSDIEVRWRGACSPSIPTIRECYTTVLHQREGESFPHLGAEGSRRRSIALQSTG